MNTIQKKLFALRDEEYRNFHSRLIPDTDPETIIGVRVPEIRKLANELYGTKEAEIFLSDLPHRYYDENMLHAILIGMIPDYGKCIDKIGEFLPYTDNWAVCDSMRPKVFSKNTESLEFQAYQWIDSDKCFTVRYGIECLMLHFLTDNFSVEHAEKVASVSCGEYYVSMMVAWYFATALAMQWDTVIPFIENRRLDPATHARTIRKAVESFRISDSQKKYLKSLK
ncbi:MAG: DNA alkylation repair protein [Clostridia bacterium]|nr:DNA alkylation repair protein [Clostridia bacterium]